MSTGKLLLYTFLSVLFFSILVFNQSILSTIGEDFRPRLDTAKSAAASVPPLQYGFNLDSVYIEKDVFEPDQFFSEILLQQGISSRRIAQIAREARSVFSVRKFRSGKPYSLIYKDSCATPSHFVYEPNPYRYILFPLRSSEYSNIAICERPVQQTVKTASGTVDHSLWMSMKNTGYSGALIDKMEDALGWSVDFYHIQKGDSYKLIYEEEFVDGKSVGIGKLRAAYFNQSGEQHYSIWYESDDYSGYFDRSGRSMKRAFLKSPVKYARISSHYDRNRYHPILKERRPHLGTDYAASAGTPIRSVADGTVTIASYTRGNGRYIKIRHDEMYETQYLHMSRFAEGIDEGVPVEQGETIGYVGSTGLATGPHVCFRFWKNGRQVNHLRENLPPPEPMAKEELPQYLDSKKQWVRQLDRIGQNSRTNKTAHSSENTKSSSP